MMMMLRVKSVKFHFLGSILLLLSFSYSYAEFDGATSRQHHNLSQTITDVNLNARLPNNNLTNEIVNLSKALRIKDVLNIFDLSLIVDQWSNIHTNLSSTCATDMLKYFHGILANNMWAVKMDDATGHYTSGFFYGNNYWLGSQTLCHAIYNYNNKAVEQKSQTDSKGLPFAKVHTQVYKGVYNENPPFIPGFFIVKFALNETSPTNVFRTLYVGVCLPSTCDLNDVHQLAEHAHKHINERDVNIIDIRKPIYDKYTFLENRTFWILVICSTVVATLVAAGTWYEIYLANQLKEALRLQDKEMMNNSETSSGIGCAASDYADSITNSDRHKRESLKELNIVLQLTQETNEPAHSEHVEKLQGHIREPQKIGLWAELLLSFSVKTNYKAICDRNVGADTIPCIHGLRALSMAWVILGHTCIVVFKYSDNMEKRKDVERNILFQAISNGAFSVDTFFFISGFLISYLYFRTNAKGKLNKLSKNGSVFATSVAHFFGLIFYRFMRLTAPYMFVLGVVQVTMEYLAASSVFDPPTIDHLTCPNYWWRNLLYINTLFPVEQMCMIWSWYLANDTQFYVIGVIILIICVRYFKLAACLTLFFLLSSWLTTGVIAFNNNHRPNTDDPLALFDKIYDKPWTRLGPYLIGMAVGWILFRNNSKLRLSRTVVTGAWALSIFNMLVLIFGLYGSDLSKFMAAAYSSLSHSAWAVSLAWITIACSTGYGGYVNKLLSATWLYPFSRVTYCAYLVHPIVIRSMSLSTDSATHLSGELVTVSFFGLVVASYLLAFIVSIAFEAPVVTMLKILSPNRKKRLA